MFQSFYSAKSTTFSNTKSYYEGVPDEISRLFISSFYSSLAQTADQSSVSFAGISSSPFSLILPISYIFDIFLHTIEMAHEAATPGGINEQAIAKFSSGDFFSKIEESLQEILQRLRR